MRQKSRKDAMSLHLTTLELLKERPVTLTFEAIALKTGLTVSWIKNFNKGVEAYSSPGVNQVQRLYEFLSGKTLTV